MAGSLLHSLSLDELITYTLEDYEEKAVELAANRNHVLELRRSIEARRSTCHLFDMPKQVRDFEGLLEQAIKQGVPNKQTRQISSMPVLATDYAVLSLFYGIVIRMKRTPEKNSQPHIYADFQGATARITLNPCEMTQSNLSKKQERLVLAWVEIHQDDLLANWDLVNHGQEPVTIEALK